MITALALINTDPVRARQILEAEAAKGIPDAIHNLAMLIGRGIGGPADPERARRMSEEAAENGSGAARITLGVEMLVDADAENDSRAVAYLLSAPQADIRVEESTRFYLGTAYLFGQGVERDLVKGMDYLERAEPFEESKGSNLAATLFLLGRGYQSGWGRTADLPRAATYFRRAGDAGHAGAMWYYGMALIQGQGVGVDKVEAYRWVRRSGEAGYINGMISTAVMLATAEGVQENDAEARVWYSRAANLGSQAALGRVGMMMLNGEGGPQDPVRGLALVEIAAERGDPQSIQIARDYARLSSDARTAVDEAKAQARQNLPQAPAP